MQGLMRRKSMVRVVLELVEQSIVLVFLELKLAALELKHNIDSAKTGAALLGLGGFLLLFSLLGVMATAIAALALVLPVWLSALIVTAVLAFGGAALLFTGLGKVKHFSLVPKDTVNRVETIAKKLRKHAELHEREVREAGEAALKGAVPAEAAAARVREAEHREAVHREAAHVKESVHQEAARARKLTFAKERALAREAREARRRRG